MKKVKSKLNSIIAVYFLIISLLTGCTLDSFGVDGGLATYTRYSEQTSTSVDSENLEYINWFLKKEDLKNFSIYDDLSYAEKVILSNSFAALFKIEDSRVKLDLVKTVSVSDDGREYLLQLKDSSWSNNNRISSQDVINSWESYNEKSKKNIFDKIGIESLEALDKSNLKISLSRANENLIYYLSDLSFRIYPSSLLKGAKLFDKAENISYSGKYQLSVARREGFVDLKLLKNDNYYQANEAYLKEIYIITDDILSKSNDGTDGYYIDSSQEVAEYDELMHGYSNFNYIPKNSMKVIAFNPKSKKLQNKSERFMLIDALDKDGISNYSTRGLSTIVDTFIKDFDRENTSQVIKKTSKEHKFNFKELKLSFIASDENRMIYDILSLMLDTKYDIKLVAEALSEEDYKSAIAKGDYELIIGDIEKFGVSSDSYLLNLDYNLPGLYEDYFTGSFYSNIKKYQGSLNAKFLEHAHESFMYEGYVYPLYNSGFPVDGDYRLDLKEFYNSYYLDFSSIRLKATE